MIPLAPTSAFPSSSEGQPSSFLNPGSLLIANSFESQFVSNDTMSPTSGWQRNHLRVYSGPTLEQQYVYPSQGEDTNNYLYPEQRQASDLLGTRQWTALTASYATSGTCFPLSFTSYIFPEVPFATIGETAHRTAPEAQIVPHSQAIQHSFSGARYDHAHIGTDVTLPPGRLSFYGHPSGNPALSTSNVTIPPSSGSTNYGTNFVHDEWQPPTVFYRSPERKDACSRRSQHACAINTQGVWIDRDDLRIGANQGSGFIRVHQCQWDKSGTPCGMWIVGTRSRVGPHIRNWHPQSNAVSAVKCLWDRCTTRKAILNGSINRHVVTVHLEETFRCRGCHREFSRKDVYSKHIKSSEGCREAGVGIMYGTESREVNACLALQRGFGGDAVRYAGP